MIRNCANPNAAPSLPYQRAATTAPMALSAAMVHCTRRFQRRNADLSGREADGAWGRPMVARGILAGSQFFCSGDASKNEVVTERIAPANLRLR
jgi:hypothetical protein